MQFELLHLVPVTDCPCDELSMTDRRDFSCNHCRLLIVMRFGRVEASGFGENCVPIHGDTWLAATQTANG